MLTEKYRPKRLNDIIGQEHIEEIKEKINNSNSLPNFIFYGEAGLGKTATAHALKNELKADIIEWNGSSENRVQDMRDKIIDSLRYSFNGSRIVLIEEAGRLTKESQSALKRPLEKYNKTMVIFCTNHFDKLIKPIKSRCKSYEYTAVDTDTIKERLDYIAQREDIEADTERIAKESDGDVRRAIVDLGMATDDDGQDDEKLKEVAEKIDF